MTRGKALGLEAEVIPSLAIRTSFLVPFSNASLGPRLLLLGTTLLILLQVVKDRAGIYESSFFLARARLLFLKSMNLDYR